MMGVHMSAVVAGEDEAGVLVDRSLESHQPAAAGDADGHARQPTGRVRCDLNNIQKAAGQLTFVQVYGENVLPDSCRR